MPEELQGTTPDNHSTLCDEVLKRKAEVFHEKRGNGKHYLDLSVLYNADGTGYTQQLVKQNMETYRRGYEQLEQRRQTLARKKGKR